MSAEAPNLSPEFNAMEQARKDSEKGRHIYDSFMQPNPDDTPADKALAAQDLVKYLESRPLEDNRGKKHNPATGEFVNGDEYFDEIRESQYDESMQKSHDQKSLSELTKEWADAENNGDRTMAGDIQDAVIERILGQKNISDDHKQELLDRVERKKEAIKAEQKKNVDEAESKEGGEKLHADHVIVQHEPNTDGLCRLGLEYALEGQDGAEIDWNINKWSRDGDPSRQMVITTESGNRYYVTGDRVYDLRASSERNRPVYFDVEELPNLKLGQGWEIPGFRSTSTVQKVEVGYKYVHEEVEFGEKRGIDPFNAAEKFIAGLGDDGEEAVEAIVDDGEQGAEVPTRRNVWKRARDAWNAGMVGLGGLLTGNRRERETDEERMSRGKKRALGIVAVGTVVGAGFYAWKHGVHVPFTGGGKSGGNSDTINHAVHGRGNGGGNGLLDVAGRPKAGNEAAQRAWYDALSPEGKTQFARMNGWESDYIRLHGGTWDDAAKAFEKFMNGQG